MSDPPSAKSEPTRLPRLPKPEEMLLTGPHSDLQPEPSWRWRAMWSYSEDGVRHMNPGNGPTPEEAVADILFMYARRLAREGAARG